MYSAAEISDAGAIQDCTQTNIMVESAAGVSNQLQTNGKLLPEHFLVTIGKKQQQQKSTSALCVVSRLLCSLGHCGREPLHS